MSAKSI